MTRKLLISAAAQADLERLFDFLAAEDYTAAVRARVAIEKGYERLLDFPLAARKATPDNPFLRELLIPFGHAGYVLLFEIEHADTLTVLAVRHQREDDYH